MYYSNYENSDLFERIQSLYIGVWSWHDNPISAADIGLLCWVSQTFANSQRSIFLGRLFQKMYDKIIT